MALGDGPVRRVLSLGGAVLSGVASFLRVCYPGRHTSRLGSQPGSQVRRVRAGEAAGGQRGARLGCGMRMARGAGSASGCEPRATGGTRQRHVDVNRICNGERSTSSYRFNKGRCDDCLKFRFHWLAFGATRRGRRPAGSPRRRRPAGAAAAGAGRASPPRRAGVRAYCMLVRRTGYTPSAYYKPNHNDAPVERSS